MEHSQSCRNRRPLDYIHLVLGLQQLIEAGRDGDVELAAAYAEDVADLRAILRLIENRALHEAIEAIDCLDTLIRDLIPTGL